MSIKIEGLDKPKSCSACKFCFMQYDGIGAGLNHMYYFCFFNGKIIHKLSNKKSIGNKLLKDCPITQLEDRDGLTD